MTALRFDIDEPLFWWITIGMGLLWCWGIYQIFASQKPFLRSVLWTIALLGAAALFLRPMHQKSRSSQRFLLLTQPYSTDSLAIFSEQYDSIFSIGWKDPALEGFANISSFLSEKKPKDFLQIKGMPLSEKALTNLQDYPYDISIPRAESGFRSLQYSRPIYENEEAILLGTFESNEEEGMRLVYETSAGARDSILLSKGVQSFSFGFRPKIPGQFLHQLLLKNKEGQVIRKTPIPLVVLPKQNYRIFMQSASANFEQRYLGDFLKEADQKAIIRRKITKEKFKNTFINQDAFAISDLDKPLLSKTDILITDTKTLSEMSTEKLKLIADQIRLNGMGCFINIDDKGVYKDWSKTFPPLGTFKWSPSNKETVFFRTGKDSTELPVFTHLPNNGAPLVEGIKQETLLANQRYGMGQIIVSSLPQTFPLILKDQATSYQLFWTKVLNVLGKKETQNVQWHFGPPEENRAQHPLFLGFRTTEKPDLRLISPAGTQQEIPIAESTEIPDYWQAGFFPEETGWYQAKVGKTETAFYVYPDSAFTSLHYHQQRKVNLGWQAKQKENAELLATKYWSPIPSLWFFLVFFLGIAGLWLLEKLT